MEQKLDIMIEQYKESVSDLKDTIEELRLNHFEFGEVIKLIEDRR